MRDLSLTILRSSGVPVITYEESKEREMAKIVIHDSGDGYLHGNDAIISFPIEHGEKVKRAVKAFAAELARG